MKWRKLGKIFEPSGDLPWMHQYAAVPIAEHVRNSVYKIYFSSRDRANRSHTGYVIVDLENPTVVLERSQTPVIAPGKLGTFDDSGAMASCMVDVGRKKYLYYIGWNLGVTVPFRNAIGLAISEGGDNAFVKYSDGPVLDRNIIDNYLVASNCVIIEGGLFRMWYLSCVKWSIVGGAPRHHYHIKYAESTDGINWCREGRIALDFKDEHEYALSVPRVVKDGTVYKMWYSFRGESYRIGYAESKDGLSWDRQDDNVGIDVSGSGWDSEMICYPYVFDHDHERYMLYNGNGYGKTGFGLAVLAQDAPPSRA